MVLKRQPQQKPQHSKTDDSSGRRILVATASLFVAVLIGVSLWVVISAIFDRINTSRGVSQIIDIVASSRQIGSTEHNFGSEGRADLIARLDKTRQLKATGEVGGLKAVINPWGDNMFAYTLPNNFFRLEAQVPSNNCQHILDLLAKNISQLGMKQIDTKGGTESWRQIYSAQAGNTDVSEEAISAGCHSSKQILMALTFTLR